MSNIENRKFTLFQILKNVQDRKTDKKKTERQKDRKTERQKDRKTENLLYFKF